MNFCNLPLVGPQSSANNATPSHVLGSPGTRAGGGEVWPVESGSDGEILKHAATETVGREEFKQEMVILRCLDMMQR